jgi:phosphoribosyl 1,2-cyclic phosphodiesterase
MVLISKNFPLYMDRLRFQSFASGSSGNCYYIGNAMQGILIDAGIGVRTIRRNLRAIGLDFHNIHGIFVTHDHSDHIRAVGSLGEIHHIPVYATRKMHEGINRSYCVTEKLNGSRRYIEKNESVQIGEFSITSFPVSHDATDCVGYTVEYRGNKVTFATDLGYVCEYADSHLKAANYIIFEANYDEKMLANGPYPADLKRRIKSDTGHLSNDQTARYLAENYRDHLQMIFLCHLSKENNRPDLAFSTVESKLTERGVKVGEDVKLITLERFTPTPLYLLS